MIDLGASRAVGKSERTSVGGFTLLELLISLAILTVILTLVMVTVRTATRTMQTIQSRAPVFHAGRLSFGLFGDTLQSAVVSTTSPQGHFQGMHEMRGEVALDRMRLNAYQFRRFPGTLPGTDPMTVEWWVHEGAVFQRESPMIFGGMTRPDRPKSSLVDTHFDLTSGIFPLADHVQEFRIRYYDGTQWVSQWASEAVGSSPRAVSIDLTLQFPGGGAQTFSTFVGLSSGHQEDF
jgi:prepilin-type N-terminal cleavage/methylation domain-containing protein